MGHERGNQGRVPFYSHPYEVTLGHGAYTREAILVPFSTILDMRSYPYTRAHAQGVIFVNMVSAGTRTRTRVTVGGPRACRMDSKTLSSLTRHAGHILCDAKASEECYKPTSRFPRPFPPGPTYDTSSGASTTTTGSAISSVGSPLSNIGPIFTGP